MVGESLCCGGFGADGAGSGPEDGEDEDHSQPIVKS